MCEILSARTVAINSEPREICTESSTTSRRDLSMFWGIGTETQPFATPNERTMVRSKLFERRTRRNFESLVGDRHSELFAMQLVRA